MIRRPPRSTQSRSSAASDVYKRQVATPADGHTMVTFMHIRQGQARSVHVTVGASSGRYLSLIHISEPTRRTPISYAVFCLKKKKKRQPEHETKQHAET